MVLVVLAAVLVVAIFAFMSERSREQTAQWKGLCVSIDSSPGRNIDVPGREFSALKVNDVFDDYLMSENDEDMPSDLRSSLDSLRGLVQKFREGTLTSEQAREAAAPAIAAINRAYDTGGPCEQALNGYLS